MSAIPTQICKLDKNISASHIQIMCVNVFKKAYALYVLNLSTLVICFLWVNYLTLYVYRVSTSAVFVIILKYKQKSLILYHTGEKTLVHSLYYYKNYMEGKIFQCSTNKMQGLYHTGEYSSHKMQVTSQMGENKLLYVLFCHRNHLDRKPYLVSYLNECYTYKVQVHHTGEKPLVCSYCYDNTHTKMRPYQYCVDNKSTVQTMWILYHIKENSICRNLMNNETHMGVKTYQHVFCKLCKIKKIYVSYHTGEILLYYSIYHHKSLMGENQYLLLHNGKFNNTFIMSHMTGNHKTIIFQNEGYE